MRDLHRGRVGVAIYGDYFNAIALEFNDNFFSQFARATHEYFGRGW